MSFKKQRDEIYEIYKEIVTTENGAVNCLDVFSIIIPISRVDEFCFPNDYRLRAKDEILAMFRNAEIHFSEVDKIHINYNLRKTYSPSM